MNDDEDEGDIVADVAKTSTERPLPNLKTKSTKKQKVEAEEIALLKQTVSALEKVGSRATKNDSTADDLFGQYIASELKGVNDEYIKRLMKHKIQNVIFD